MLPNFLLPEAVVRQDGTGPGLELSGHVGKSILLTLGITQTIEQESLDIAIYGSADGTNWDDKPLVAFPQKFYCGTYTLLLDLTSRPDVKHIRAQWKMNRWGRGTPTPLFGFYVFVQDAERMSSRAVA